MNQKKEDRRIRITKQAVRESFIELMGEYPIAKISVRMICESADINRSTFYSHYANQYDLMRKIQDETISEIKAYLAGKAFTENSEATVSLLAQVLEYARSNAAVLIVLLNDNSDTTFKNELMDITHEQAMKELSSYASLDPQNFKYLKHFAIDGFTSVLKTWLEDGAPDEPEQLAETITHLIFQGMSAFYQ